MKCLLAAVVLPGVLFFSACTANVDVRVLADGSTAVSYDALFGDAFIEVMKSLSEAGSGSLFDTKTIAEQFRTAGIPNVKVSSKADTSLAVSALLPAGSKDPVSASGCLSADANSLTLSLSPGQLSALYKTLPESVKSYIDLFMAPVFSGESMSVQDYTGLVASVYGKPLSDEVAAAKVRITLYGPAGSGKSSSVTVPLTDILTAVKPLVYTVTW
jgi:hypothetical protein